MKVMIMKCSKTGAWWSSSIGKSYEVIKDIDEDCLIKVKDKKAEGNHILKRDCEVIEK